MVHKTDSPTDKQSSKKTNSFSAVQPPFHHCQLFSSQLSSTREIAGRVLSSTFPPPPTIPQFWWTTSTHASIKLRRKFDSSLGGKYRNCRGGKLSPAEEELPNSGGKDCERKSVKYFCTQPPTIILAHLFNTSKLHYGPARCCLFSSFFISIPHNIYNKDFADLGTVKCTFTEALSFFYNQV